LESGIVWQEEGFRFPAALFLGHPGSGGSIAAGAAGNVLYRFLHDGCILLKEGQILSAGE
jgi:hypothetical protein